LFRLVSVVNVNEVPSPEKSLEEITEVISLPQKRIVPTDPSLMGSLNDIVLSFTVKLTPSFCIRPFTSTYMTLFYVVALTVYVSVIPSPVKS